MALAAMPVASSALHQPSSSARADSIQIAAQDPDFVRVSLLTTSAGRKVYSAYGHAALRLECPSRGLDYCFTFEMALTPNEKLRFFLGHPKAGFIAAPTARFLAQYKEEGREVMSYTLNLLPDEEQALWRSLDEEMARGACWDFDVTEHTCTSMVAWVVQKSLRSGTITYHDLPTELATGTYRDVVDLCSGHAPWSGLFWKTRIGAKGFRHAAPDRMMMPVLMGQVWMQATIDDAEGHSRPLVLGQGRQLFPSTWQPTATRFTPTRVGAIFALLMCCMIWWHCNRKRRRLASRRG